MGNVSIPFILSQTSKVLVCLLYSNRYDQKDCIKIVDLEKHLFYNKPLESYILSISEYFLDSDGKSGNPLGSVEIP